jgi:hypothetical protein
MHVSTRSHPRFAVDPQSTKFHPYLRYIIQTRQALSTCWPDLIRTHLGLIRTRIDRITF